MKKPELLAPGGSFLSAYYALEAGADGVYLGLTEFSARKSAANFTFDQLRRIRGLAAVRGRKIYVTVNTIIRENELSTLADVLARLEAAGVDGVIVQDFGVLSILRRHFPGLPIHASTQMAVHTSAGIGYLEKLGVKRVILPRELTLERIRALRESHPGMELEVFVHGALCYGFSGICLASSALTGRSGNRGDCAQICRSHFIRERMNERADGPFQGYFFSCRDLCLGLNALELAQAGVDAFKIEGRMKSPEYVSNAVRLYRGIIDRGADMPEAEYRDLLRRSDVSYSREKTIGFLHSGSGADLIDLAYPGHRGAVIGAVKETRGNGLCVQLESDLSIRDGLAFFPRTRFSARTGGNLRAPFIFPVRRIRMSGKDVKFARKGDTVLIPMPESSPVPAAGQSLFQLSSRFLDLRQPREAAFPLWRAPVDLEITLFKEGGAFAFRIECVGGLPAFAEGVGTFSMPVILEPASQPRSFSEVLRRLFGESGDSFFTLGRLVFSNGTGNPDDGIFVPPSVLKRVKKEFYLHLDAGFAASIARKAHEVEFSPNESPGAAEETWVLPPTDVLSRRGSLSPAGCAPVAFTCGDIERVDGMIAGIVFLPLPPVILEEKPLVETLKRRIVTNPRVRFAVGLSNISHLALAEELSVLENARFFIDFPLYAANHWAYEFFKQHVKKLLFQYFWIEGDAGDYSRLADIVGREAPLIRIDHAFRAPLFIALGCFAKHVLNGGSCAHDCSKEYRELLRQGGNRFELHVKDCVTYLFLRP